MTEQEIEQELDILFSENLFSIFRQMASHKMVKKFKKSAEYNSSTEIEKKKNSINFTKK